ncbi:MAG: hypothetical protein IJT23_10315 [Clostridia bacterium]|nr:hypothetical protein [Clostridia bacterium]
MFFRYYHILPFEVGKQNPVILFDMLDSLDTEQDIPDSGYLNMFYGR